MRFKVFCSVALVAVLVLIWSGKPVGIKGGGETQERGRSSDSDHPGEGKLSGEPGILASAQQMRWPFSDTNGVHPGNSYPAFHSEVEALIREGDAASIAQAIDRLKAAIAVTTFEAQLAAIGEEGPAPGEKREALYATRDRAYEYALLWLLEGKRSHLEHSKALLLRLAQVVAHWPLYDRQKALHQQDERKYLRDSEANGLWGRWHPLDLAVSIPLLRAYDILRPALTKEERGTLERDLFLYHKEFIGRFTGLWPLYHNLAGYHLIPLIRYGQILERPDFIHEAVRYWDEMLRYSYTADGFYHEVTPDYHLQITSRLLGSLPEMLKGYSDPKGYVDPVSGKRFDDLDLAVQNAARIDQIRAGLVVLLLPDGSYANLNDSWPKKTGIKEREAVVTEPGLLGIAGVAKLASGKMAAMLKFGGIRGHDHRDALNLIWFAGNREVFSDTGYKSPNGSDIVFEREWSASTASHVTAAIDEQIHFTDRAPARLPSPAGGFLARPPAVEGEHPVEVALPIGAQYANQGRLLIWDGRNAGVQAMEAEQPNAYPGTASLFRRTIVMVPLENGEGYLVDLFRISGGATHDYFLRGGLDEPYRLAFHQPLQAATGTLYSHITLKGSAAVQGPLTATASYGDGLRVISHLGAAAATGADWGRLALKTGEAPAIRRSGLAPFSLIRRTSASPGEELESCFAWVHETTSGKERVRRVKVSTVGSQVVVEVALDDRTDRIFSGLDDESRFSLDGWQFEGRLAFASIDKAGARSGVVFSGSDLRAGQVVAAGKPWLTGTVISTTQKDEGEANDSLLIASDHASPGTGAYHLAHVDFGDTIRFSIPIQSVTQEKEGLRVILAHPPGFRQEDGYSSMTRFPGWRVEGETTVRLE